MAEFCGPYGHSISAAMIRRVWASVTRTPGAPIRAIAEDARTCLTTAHNALSILRDMGYIAYDDDTAGGRQVLIPFHIIRRKGRQHA